MDRTGERDASNQDKAGRCTGGLLLLFAPDKGGGERRPDVTAISDAALASGRHVTFTISHQPDEHPYWLELLALGLTFDLQGLFPGVPVKVAPARYAFGTSLADAEQLEAVSLHCGPHLAAGVALLPVVRAMLALGCELATLPHLRAIGWEPAGTVMSVEYFCKTVSAWLHGGAFPGLGLTALDRTADGMMSRGLCYFIGHEVEIIALPGEAPADTARFALRVIHLLVENGPYTSGPLEGPGGELLQCEYDTARTLLRIRRESDAAAG